MRILLAAVNAKYIHSNPAVYSLRAYAKERGTAAEIAIAEFTINQTPEEILREIYERKPQVLAFSCYIWNLEMIGQLLADLPCVLPDTEIWLGGPEVSYDAEQFLAAHRQVRGILTGEGEETFWELANWYVDHEGAPKAPEKMSASLEKAHAPEKVLASLEKAHAPEKVSASLEKAHAQDMEHIRGLVVRTADGEIRRTAPRPLLSMDDLPFLYSHPEEFENRIVYYESSRGCPFSCSYCLSSIDKTVRFRDTEKVKAELQIFLDHRVPQVKFVDRTFNCRHSHALEIWRYIRDHDNGVTNFHFEIAADLLNDEEIRVVQSMRPGLIQMEIGVQSTNPETLREIRRVSDFAHLSGIVRRLQEKKNIHLHLDLIAGLPMEDFESFVRSFNDVYSLHPQQLQLGFLKVLKGSHMHDMAQDYGLCFRRRPVYEVLATRWISYPELLRLKDVEEMVEIYYNSGQFTHVIRSLEKEFAHPFALFAALADYMRQHASAGQKKSRPARFELLYEFVQDGGIVQDSGTVSDSETARDSGIARDSRIAPDRVQACRELLLLDLYLRENCRERPAWAPEPSKEKDRMWEFFRAEEQEHRFLPGYEGRSAKQMMHMTHLERFRCDVLGDQKSGEHWLLFDYQRRDAVTGNAYVQDVTADFPKTSREFPKTSREFPENAAGTF